MQSGSQIVYKRRFSMKEQEKVEKKPKKDMVKEDSEKEQNNQQNKKDDIIFNNRMSPAKLFSMIPKFNDAQKEAIRSLGFGGFLEVKMNQVPKPLAQWACKNFDFLSCSLALSNGRRLTLDTYDVYQIFGLPMGKYSDTFECMLDSQSKQDEREYKSELDRFMQAYFNGDKGVIASMPEKILEFKDGGEMFQWGFLMYVFCTMLMGNQNRYINKKAFRLFVKLDEVKQYNWCLFALKSLCHSVEKWQAKNDSYFDGPILLLLAFYLDRVSFMFLEHNRSFPIIGAWDNDSVNERVNFEKNYGFGKGIINPRMGSCFVCFNECAGARHLVQDPRTPFPDGEIEAFYARKPTASKQQSEKEHIEVSSDKSENVDNCQRLIKKFLEVANDLARSFKQFRETSKAAFEFSPNVSAAKKLASHDSKIFSFFRDFVKEEEEQTKAPSDGGHEGTLSQDEDFWNNPKILEALEILMDSIEGGFLNDPMFDNQQPSPTTPPPPSNPANDDLDEHVNQVISNVVDEIMIDAQVEEPAENKSDEHANQAKNDDLVKKKSDEALELPIKKKPNRKITHMPPSMCSPYLDRVAALKKKFTSRERQCVRIIFAKDADNNEILAKSKWGELTRKNLKSLVYKESYVDDEVVNEWSRFLNNLELYRNVSSVSRFFFTSNCVQSLVLAHGKGSKQKSIEFFVEVASNELAEQDHIDLKKVDLIFIPICAHEHYFLFCSNIQKQENLIIDNLIADVPQKKRYGTLPQRVATALGYFMKTKVYDGSDSCPNIEDFKLSYANMPWFTKDNRTDCGVFLMRHMETFFGDVNDWPCDLEKDNQKQINMLRVTYADLLLTYEKNLLRNNFTSSPIEE